MTYVSSAHNSLVKTNIVPETDWPYAQRQQLRNIQRAGLMAMCVPLLINAMGWGESREIAYEGVKGKADLQAGWQQTQVLPRVSPLGRKDTEETKQNQQGTGRWMESEWAWKCQALPRERLPARVNSLVEMMGRTVGGSGSNWSWNTWHLNLLDSCRWRAVIWWRVPWS